MLDQMTLDQAQRYGEIAATWASAHPLEAVLIAFLYRAVVATFFLTDVLLWRLPKWALVGLLWRAPRKVMRGRPKPDPVVSELVRRIAKRIREEGVYDDNYVKVKDKEVVVRYWGAPYRRVNNDTPEALTLNGVPWISKINRDEWDEIRRAASYAVKREQARTEGEAIRVALGDG